MKFFAFRRIVGLLLCFTLLIGACLMTGCANKGTPLLELDGRSITTNQYQLLLSRIKGTLSRGGYSVDSATFWEMVVDSDGTTYDEYFRQAALTDSRRYLAALAIFEEEGLVLPQSEKSAIDKEMDDFITAAGSKSALNSELSRFGINIDMLRELYTMEAKFRYLQVHLYGEKGSKVAAQVRQEYLLENAACFRQLLIRSYYYVYEKDANGDEIYYLTGENNAKVNNIAYDAVKGLPRNDEHGEPFKDKNGDVIYYLEDEGGRIAYDKEKGVRSPVMDKNGVSKTEKYTKEQLAELKEAGEEILASVAAGDYTAFEAALAECEAADNEAFYVVDSDCFVYTTGDNSYDYLNDIADKLAASSTGEIQMLNSEYGYHIIMEYPIPEDAASNTAYQEWFGDLAERVVAKLFHAKCQPYMDKVRVDEKAFASLPSMQDVGTNFTY